MHVLVKYSATASCILLASWYINHRYLVNKTLKIKGEKNERETTEMMIYASGIYNMYLEAPDTLWMVKVEPLVLGLPSHQCFHLVTYWLSTQ